VGWEIVGGGLFFSVWVGVWVHECSWAWRAEEWISLRCASFRAGSLVVVCMDLYLFESAEVGGSIGEGI
jgi:hypothetical protein